MHWPKSRPPTELQTFNTLYRKPGFRDSLLMSVDDTWEIYLASGLPKEHAALAAC